MGVTIVRHCLRRTRGNGLAGAALDGCTDHLEVLLMENALFQAEFEESATRPYAQQHRELVPGNEGRVVDGSSSSHVWMATRFFTAE